MKYIDAEKLIAEIRKLRSESCIGESDDYYEYAKSEIIDIIDSLQQEHPDSSKGKFVFPNFLYARTVDNKTIDVSYAPQSMDAVEYIKNDPTEQPEVDLGEDVRNYLKTHHLHIKDGGRVVFDNGDSPNFMCDIRDIACHFYELGLNARKEE